MQAQTRFVAEWIAAQHADASGEWTPDDDEYEGEICTTLEQAKQFAIKHSKACNVVEWVRVTEERKTKRYGWDAVRSWTGDWAGNWSEVR
jgi:hypothetical protein